MIARDASLQPSTCHPSRMLTLATSPTRSFTYRKTKPFTKAEFKFKTALADYASERLLEKLQARASVRPARNRHTGITARITADVVYLEAVLVNDVEWGGLAFEFARLVPANNGRYNLSLRRAEDWTRAETLPVRKAANFFLNASLFPRASAWNVIARGKTFEQCVAVLERHLNAESVPLDQFDQLVSFPQAAVQ